MFKRIPNGFRAVAGCARPGKSPGRREIPGKEMKIGIWIHTE